MKQMTNSSQFDTVSRPPANPVYSMEFCPINQAPNILAVTDEVGAVTLIDTQEGAKYKIRACELAFAIPLLAVELVDRVA
jgi:hypothetical protein